MHLSPRALQGFASYRYSGAGYTWLDEVHQPFWNGIVDALPRTVAPNLLTFLGLICVITSMIALWLGDPDGHGDIPRWVPLVCAVALFLYMTLDAIDGKQARRTGTSSPLGQLFDHGVDALIVHLSIIGLVEVLGVNSTWLSLLLLYSVMMPWIVCNWAEYHTGHMEYSNGYFGVTEGEYALIMLHLFTAIFGPEMWHIVVFENTQFTVTVVHVLFYVMLVSNTIITAQQFCRVFANPFCLEKDYRGFKELGRFNAFKHILPFILVWIAGFIWALSGQGQNQEVSSGLLAQAGGGLSYSPRMFFGIIGLAFALLASRLVISHMAKEPFHALHLDVYLPLLVATLNSYLGLFPEDSFTTCVYGVMLLVYVVNVWRVIAQIALHLRVPVFTIRKH